MSHRLVRGARHPLARVVVAMLAVVTVTVVALWWSQREPRPPSGSTDALRFGVPPGSSISEYVLRARRDLVAMPASGGYALVSLDRYAAPDALPELLAEVTLAEVVIRVPLPGEQTEILYLPARTPADVLAGMARVAARKETEYTATSDPALARVAAAEAGQLRAGCACVYAAVVRGTAAQLVTVSGRSGVRAVEPALSVVDLQHAVFLPPLPEQSTIALPPSGR